MKRQRVVRIEVLPKGHEIMKKVLENVKVLGFQNSGFN